MTPLPVSIAAAVASFLLLVVVFELIRSRNLQTMTLRDVFGDLPLTAQLASS